MHASLRVLKRLNSLGTGPESSPALSSAFTQLAGTYTNALEHSTCQLDHKSAGPLCRQRITNCRRLRRISPSVPVTAMVRAAQGYLISTARFIEKTYSWKKEVHFRPSEISIASATAPLNEYQNYAAQNPKEHIWLPLGPIATRPATGHGLYQLHTIDIYCTAAFGHTTFVL